MIHRFKEDIHLNILFVVPSPKIDTPHSMSFVKRLARALEEQGVNVETMLSVKSSNPLSFFKLGGELRKKISQLQPDLVVAQYGTFTGLLVALFAPRPKIITYRGSDLNPTPSENRFYVLLKHLASHAASFFADGIICVSHEIAGRLLCKKLVEVIPSSTDIELFSPMDRSACRKMLNWDQTAPTALFISGDDPGKKRLDVALEVKNLIANNSHGVQLKIIREKVPLSQMPVYLNAADCLVYLSDFEGSPNLIREACACATPIVTVPVGDVREVLSEVTHGKIVDRDPRKIADAVIELTRLQVRSNGRDKALHYSNKETALKTLYFYRRVIARVHDMSQKA